MEKTRILVLASSSNFAASLARDLHFDSSLEIVASVFTDRDAVATLTARGADLILCDTRIAGLNVQGFAQRVKALPKSAPVIILVKAGDPNAAGYKRIAADVLTLPLQDTPLMHQNFARDLSGRIKRLTGGGNSISTLRYKWRPGLPFATRFQGIIALGASAGGTEATEAVLRKLPPNLPGMVITQHMPPVFTKVYAERLDKISPLRVREAADGDEVRPGQVLVAPGGMQMRVMKAPGKPFPYVRCHGEERVSGHCPSVDALFESVASSLGSGAIGIILTGMGSDGAEGLLAMKRKGCFTIGQDEATSMVYGMPRVAYLKGGVTRQLPLEEIPQALCSHLMA